MTRVRDSLTGVLLLLIAGTGSAVFAVEAVHRPGDKTAGEEEQIAAREQYFLERRGLVEIERPDLVRAGAVEAVRAAMTSRRYPTLQWVNLGPESMTMLGWSMGQVAGRVSAVAVHPTDEDIIYLGAASGGLWKTINGGASWTPIFDDVGTQTIGAIFIEPDAPDRVWVGTGEQGQWCGSYFGMGLFLSTDGGETFSQMNGTAGAPLEISYVSGIAVHPVDSQIVLAGGHGFCDDGTYYAGGLFRSADGGATWTRKYSGPVSDVIIDPNSPNIMYVAYGRWGWPGDGVYKSTDAGVTWNRLTNGIPYGSSVYRIRLTMAPSDSQTLYALVNESSNSKLYKTIDGGASWIVTNSDACEGQCDYNLCLAVDPANPASLVMGTIRHATSIDSGTTLTYRTEHWGSTQTVHQDTHVVLYSRLAANRYWVGTDGGLWRSDDGGASFTNLNANLDITQFYDITVHPGDAEIVFGGTQDNSSQKRNADPLWDVTAMTGDGFMNLVDPADTLTVFQTSYPSGGYPWLCRFTNGGVPDTCSWLNPGGLVEGEPYPWVTPLAIADADEQTPTRVFLGSHSVYRAVADQDAGSFTWTKIADDVSGDGSAISVITPFFDGNSVGLYVGAEDGTIWRTGDAMATLVSWNNVTGNFAAGVISDIAVDPKDVNRVYATRSEFSGARLLRSDVGGGTWTGLGSDLPEVPANSVAVDPLVADRIFVGTDVGVLMSLDGGHSFAVESQGLPLGMVVTDLEIDDAPYRLTVGTYGRGAWQADLAAQGLIFCDGFESADTSRWATTVAKVCAPPPSQRNSR